MKDIESKVAELMRPIDDYAMAMIGVSRGTPPERAKALAETVRAALRTALESASRLPDGWQPIETAPRDGTTVLVNDTTPGYTPWVAAMYIESKEWSGWAYDDEATADSNPLGPNPTHWIPLPAPTAFAARPEVPHDH
jgi:hypothetical protein